MHCFDLCKTTKTQKTQILEENDERYFEPISAGLNKIGREIVDAAYQVHKTLGPGLLERVYEVCFCHELTKKEINFERQVDIPISYDGLMFDEGLRLDVLVEKEIICELKSVDETNPVWEAQVLSHLKLMDKRLGYLINFNVKNIGKGIQRFVL